MEVIGKPKLNYLVGCPSTFGNIVYVSSMQIKWLFNLKNAQPSTSSPLALSPLWFYTTHFALFWPWGNIAAMVLTKQIDEILQSLRECFPLSLLLALSLPAFMKSKLQTDTWIYPNLSRGLCFGRWIILAVTSNTEHLLYSPHRAWDSFSGVA